MARAFNIIVFVIAVLWLCATAYRWWQAEPASSGVWIMALCGGAAVARGAAVAVMRG